MEHAKLENEKISTENENTKKELENLEKEFEQTIIYYCEKRNEYTKNMDIIRENAAQVEQLSCNFSNGKFFIY